MEPCSSTVLGIAVRQEASLIFMSTLPVGQEALKSLQRELHPVTDKWFSLGVQLQIPVEILKCIEAEHNQMNRRLLEMLTVWLRCTNPPPTWDILTEALESPPVGEMLLAQQLRDKYCPSAERGSTHGYPFQGPTTLPSPDAANYSAPDSTPTETTYPNLRTDNTGPPPTENTVLVPMPPTVPQTSAPSCSSAQHMVETSGTIPPGACTLNSSDR